VRTGVLVQVRLGSTRLASKALLPVPGASVIQHVMRACAAIPAEVHALLTDAASSDALLPVAKLEGFTLQTGSAEDVLDRYCAACEAMQLDRVVRATGDNPLTSAELARSIMALHERAGADLSHYLGNPWGTGVEIVETRALLTARRQSKEADEREHITTWLYRHREGFTILEPQAPAEALYPEGRVTVDSEEDYLRVKEIFHDLYQGRPIEVGEVIQWLKTHGDQPVASGLRTEGRDG